MKTVFFLSLFFSFAGKAFAGEAETLFQSALLKLQEGKTKESSALFYEFLKIRPDSLSARFNLAISLYRQSAKPDPARAYLRQVLFKKPYNKQVRAFLRELKDKEYFWLWLPKDLVLILMALSWLSILPFRAFWKLLKPLRSKKAVFLQKAGKNKVLRFSCWAFFLCAQGFGVLYFYHRRAPYGTLIQDSVVLSAPSEAAPALFKEKAGALIRLLPVRKKNLSGWSHVQISRSKSGWLRSDTFLPLNPQKPRKKGPRSEKSEAGPL